MRKKRVMRKTFVSFLKSIVMFFAMSVFTIQSWAQVNNLQPSPDIDYSQFIKITNDKQQQWELQGVASNEVVTALFFKIHILSRNAGGFGFPSNIYISGDFGTMSPIGLQVVGKDYPLGKIWNYGQGNKGKSAECIIYFNRVPGGVSQINYTEPNFINWHDITIPDNPNPAEQSQWTDGSLKEYWTENRCSNVEGIYYFTNTTNKEWWGTNKHTLAIVKDGFEYKIVYLKGSNPKIWSEGEIKGVFVATASPGLYKATTWLMENKMSNDDFYLKFEDGTMMVYENTSNVSATFLKLFPANDTNSYSNSGHGSETQSNQVKRGKPSSQSEKGSGSGIFVSPKVIATNYHLIENIDRIEVSVKNGNTIETHPAKVLCSDKTNDLALLLVDDEKFTGMPTLPYAILSKSKDVGTSVFAMGYPLADYMGDEVKITDGIISSRTGFEGDIVTYQISAPIQPGSSGGPLFDKLGNLIGITNAGIASAQNVGYAIKASYLCNLIESAPINVAIPENNTLESKELTEQIKELSKYVVYIRVF